MFLWHFGTIGGGGVSDGEGGCGGVTKVMMFGLEVLLKQELLYRHWNCESEVVTCYWWGSGGLFRGQQNFLW